MNGAPSSVLRDLSFALRVHRRRPVAPAFAALTLAVGIAAATAVFSVVDNVLLTPLPLPESERLVQLYSSRPRAGWRRMTVSIPDFLDWQASSRCLAAAGAYTMETINFDDHGTPEQAAGVRASTGLLPTLALTAVAGRLITTPDELSRSGPVAMLSSSFWHRRYRGDPGVIDRLVRLDGVPHRIVGVLPPATEVAVGVFDLWLPFDAGATPSERSQRSQMVIARLSDGTTVEGARRELETIARRLEADFPESNLGHSVVVQPLAEVAVNDAARSTLYAVSVGVIAVLLIASVNIANLLLVTVAERRHEFAVRSALGAVHGQLVRQLLAESLLLAGLGGLLGLAVTPLALRLLLSLLADAVTPIGAVAVGWRALAFATLVLTLCTIGFGLPAGMRAAAGGSGHLLRAGNRSVLGGRTLYRRHGALVVAQVALALTLLVNAMLMIRSAQSLLAVDPGFAPRRLVTARLSLPEQRFPTEAARASFVQRVVDELRSVPAVEAAAAASTLPLVGDTSNARVTVEAWLARAGEESVFCSVVSVTPGFFAVMGIPLLAGRDVAGDDLETSAPVVVVNRLMAERLWADGDPVGQRLKFGRPDTDSPWMEVVGVVGDVHHSSLRSVSPLQIFLPQAQLASPIMNLVVRAHAEPETVRGALSATVSRLDPSLALSEETAMVDIVHDNTRSQRRMATVLAFLSAIALLLATGGLYAVVAFTTQRRIPEIGLRLALGADRRTVLKEVLRRSVALVVIGVAVGGGAAWLLSRSLRDLLFGVSPFDPLSYAGVSALMITIGVLAALLPAWRAARVDAAVILRCD